MAPPEKVEDGKGPYPERGRSGLFSRRPSLKSPREALQPEAAPPPPPLPPTRKKRRPIVSTASGILSFVLIAAVGLVILLALSQERIRAPGPLAADKVVVIASGTDVADIIGQLEREGVIESPFLMTSALWSEGTRRNVKAGEYLFHQNASLREVIDTLVSGKQVLHAITIPEGLTSEQVTARVRDNDVLAGDVKDVPREGTLMPDTYKFARGMTRDALLRAMQAAQKKVVDDVWARRSPDIPIKSSYELTTLASIVEKETGRADERPRVAGVFINRLSKGMRLQSDPTIVYGLVGGKGTLGRGILKSEVDRATPYNTYVINGLPQGPIANPGRAALEAVANPSRTKDLYFVADGTGGHAFAETLDQHARNVTRWRQIEKDAKDRLVPDADKTVGPQLSPIGPVKPEQRGDATLAVPVFGGLTFSTGDDGRASGRMDAFPLQVGAATATVPAAEPANGALAAITSAATPEAAAPKSKSSSVLFAFAPSAEQIGLSEHAPPAVDPDEGGPIGTGDLVTIPVAPGHRAEQKAQAARFGLAPGVDTLPAPSRGMTSAAEPAARGASRPRVVDVSEGTPLDPLLNKSYDLNSAKVVPSMKAMP